MIYIGYPSNVRPAELALWVIGFLLRNGLKGVFMSLRMSSSEVKRIIAKILSWYGIDDWIAKYISENYLDYYSINPISTSLAEAMHYIINISGESSADVMIIHGIEILDLLYGGEELMELLENLIMSLRQQGKIIIVMGSTDFVKTRKLVELFSDFSFEFVIGKKGELEAIAYIRGQRPRRATTDIIDQCSEEAVNYIKRTYQ